jgi:hypothetical protein
VKRLLPVLVILLWLAIPVELFAKAETSKIIIKGADLSAPIEIKDPSVLAKFSVWTGTGDELYREVLFAKYREFHR